MNEKTYYVVKDAHGFMAAFGSSEAHMMVTENVAEALIWESPNFASVFAGVHSAHTTVLDRTKLNVPVGTFYIGFTSLEDSSEIRNLAYFPESTSHELRSSYNDYVAALCMVQIMRRKYGHEYVFSVTSTPIPVSRARLKSA